MARQFTTVNIGAYFSRTLTNYNAFPNFPVNIDCWNMRHWYESDFVNGAETTSLSGNSVPGLSGQRPMLDLMLDNSNPTNSANIRALLQFSTNQFNRVAVPTSSPEAIFTAQSISGQNITIPIGVGANTSAANFYVGLSVYNNNSNRANQYVRITVYNPTSRVCTVEGSMAGWQTGDGFQVVAEPNMPTYIGVRTDSSNAPLEYYVLTNSIFGINRDLTINKQIITLNLRGRLRRNFIRTEAQV